MYIHLYIYIYVESTGDCGGAFAAVHVVCCCACGSLFCFHVYYIMLLAAASNPIRHAYTLSSTTGACLLVFLNFQNHCVLNVFSKSDGKPSKYKLNQRKTKKTNKTIENNNKPMISVSQVLKSYGFVEYFMVWFEKL